MDDELVADLSDESKGVRKTLTPTRYSQKFEELCGFYLSIGMTYDDYWNGDCEMTKYYRDKYERDRENKNFELWLQGAYIYEAILDASPVLNALSKKKKPLPYRDKPIEFKETKEKYKEEKNKQKMKNGIRKMQELMTAWNTKFQKKEVENG